MFGWRRRSEGFEWREYVRTTILVRRADRQRRVEDVRVAALDKVKEQRDRALEAGKAGVEAAAGVVSDVARTSAELLRRFAIAAWRGLMSALGWFAGRAGAVFGRLPMPDLRLWPQFAGAGRRIFDLMADVARRSPISARHVMYAVGGLGLIYVGGPMLRGEPARIPAIRVANLVPATSAGSLSGRATALSGDSLRIDGELVRLSGIEAPAPAHPCLKANGRRWSCGATATSALQRLVRGRIVSCDVSGVDDAGRKLASCRMGETDIAGELVRGGHVFAGDGMFASYANDEDSARTARTGLWQGETVRPKEWRERAWEEAKRTAPEGCPIKGIVRASARLYAMPWSDGYIGAKVRTIKGERWFCSEDDARAAGFRLADRS